jgi:hypothetical protein
MRTITIPVGEQVTVYSVASIYHINKINKPVVLLQIIPALGTDPHSDEYLQVLAVKKDRQKWDTEAFGPYRQAKLLGCAVARMVPVDSASGIVGEYEY